MPSFLWFRRSALVLALTSPLPLAAANFFDANAGTYSGTFQNGQGFWALVVPSWPDFNVRFVGYLPHLNKVFIAPPTYGTDWTDDGFFSIDGMSGTSSYFQANIYGQIAAGQITGFYHTMTYDEPITGALASSDGAFRQAAGSYFVLRDLAGIGREAHVIVSPGGAVTIGVLGYAQLPYGDYWNRTPAWAYGASGTLDAAGHVHLEAPQGLSGELSIDADRQVRAVLAVPGVAGPVEFTGASPVSRLVNLSSRAWVAGEQNVAITGFVIAGTGTKRVLLRAMGPALAARPFSLGSALDDPRFVVMHDGVAIASSDNWGDAGHAPELLEAMNRTGAFPAASGSADAMALLDLPAGAYTVVASGAPGTSGVGLAEVYAVDDNDSADARLVNLSTRAHVGTGDAVMISGLVVTGNVPRTVLIRAVGPTLALPPYDVAGVLDDPVVHVYREGSDVAVATNDDWDASAVPAANLRRVSPIVGAFALPAQSRDAALLVSLDPGASYTVVVSGKNGATGVALAEIYEVGAQP